MLCVTSVRKNKQGRKDSVTDRGLAVSIKPVDAVGFELSPQGSFLANTRAKCRAVY